MRITLLLSLTLFLGSCGEVAPDSQTGVMPVIEEIKPTEKLNQWLDSQYEKQLSCSPEKRSRLGEKTDYEQLNDYSLAAQTRVLD